MACVRVDRRDGGSNPIAARELKRRASEGLLFWINVAVGCGLAMLCAVLGPIVVAFYHEPPILWSGGTFGESTRRLCR